VSDPLPARLQHALAAFHSGDPSAAQRLCEDLLHSEPRSAGALQLLGVICAQNGNSARALALFGEALRLEPGDALTHSFKAIVHQDLAQWEQSLASYDRAIALRPDFAEACSNRGNVLMQLERWDAALASFDRALAVKPDYAGAHVNRGNLFKALRQWQAALRSYDRALEIAPDFADAHSNRGNVLMELHRWEAALASYDRALEIRPDFAIAHYNRGNVLRALKRQRAAIASYDRAIAIDPAYAGAHHNRGNACLDLRLFEAAIASYERALALDPAIEFLLGTCRHAKMQICDWDGLEADIARLTADIACDRRASPPFPVLALIGSAPLQRRAASIWVSARHPANPALGPIAAPGPAPIAEHRAPERIRLGYFSADFHEHPVSYLTAELFESHDRSRFEVTAFSFGPDTQDAMRRRLERAFDAFLDVRQSSDQDVAQLARARKIDIAVDLSGFTQGGRPGVFALRAAPLQVSYIGYLGTLAAQYIDYLIADETLVPPSEQQHYAEKIIYLPSFQANQSTREMAEPVAREQLGLPASGFVFCCFNSNYKILPALWERWMRLLAGVAGSVLWLFVDNGAAQRNLGKEAARRGVDPERIVFASRLPRAQYLARFRAADLFLDTLPYNAGATAADALWAGLPVLTCLGEAFAGRVAASLLRAIGLPELITRDLDEYQRVALQIAADPQRLAALRGRLETCRHAAAPFDVRGFARRVEAAYTAIHERHRAGRPPEHIGV